MTDKIHELLNFWFGHVGSADLPSSDRANLWFGDNEVVKQKLLQLFTQEFEQATNDKLAEWANTPRGRLALIILYDQFPRYIYRRSAQAFEFDQRALQLCIDGLDKKMDHSLTLIDRVFFYMPLVHAESQQTQQQSIRLYQDLVSLSMSEAGQMYKLFLSFSY